MRSLLTISLGAQLGPQGEARNFARDAAAAEVMDVIDAFDDGLDFTDASAMRLFSEIQWTLVDAGFGPEAVAAIAGSMGRIMSALIEHADACSAEGDAERARRAYAYVRRLAPFGLMFDDMVAAFAFPEMEVAATA